MRLSRFASWSETVWTAKLAKKSPLLILIFPIPNLYNYCCSASQPEPKKPALLIL